jgi:hypothetical protein
MLTQGRRSGSRAPRPAAALDQSCRQGALACSAGQAAAQIRAENGAGRCPSEPELDQETVALFQSLVQSPKHRPTIERIDALRKELPHERSLAGYSCAIAPGAFYKEFPNTGADGRLLREAAELLGCRTEVIPTPSMGSLTDNAEAILKWLSAHQNQPIILASVSKGGSDIKAALAQSGAAEAFRSVVAWISVGGILDGSPMVNWLLARPLRLALHRVLFWLRGYNFEVIADLRYGPGAPLSAPLVLPPHLHTIHVIGFPLTEHMTRRMTRIFRQRIAGTGPSDGAISLTDVGGWPGVIYPVWGADHYMRPSWELRSLAVAIFAHLARRQANGEAAL